MHVMCVQSSLIVKVLFGNFSHSSYCVTLCEECQKLLCLKTAENKVEMFVAAKSGESVHYLRSLAVRDMTCIVYRGFHFTD